MVMTGYDIWTYNKMMEFGVADEDAKEVVAQKRFCYYGPPCRAGFIRF